MQILELISPQNWFNVQMRLNNALFANKDIKCTEYIYTHTRTHTPTLYPREFRLSRVSWHTYLTSFLLCRHRFRVSLWETRFGPVRPIGRFETALRMLCMGDAREEYLRCAREYAGKMPRLTRTRWRRVYSWTRLYFARDALYVEMEYLTSKWSRDVVITIVRTRSSLIQLCSHYMIKEIVESHR